jgi:putative transposase
MKQKKHSTEEIIRILRQADGDGTIESICRERNISKATFHRWRRKYGDMDLADAKRLKELERENAELKKMLAESMLKNRVLEEVNAKNGKPDTEEASRRLCVRPWILLGASGVSLPGCASVHLPLSS